MCVCVSLLRGFENILLIYTVDLYHLIPLGWSIEEEVDGIDQSSARSGRCRVLIVLYHLLSVRSSNLTVTDEDNSFFSFY